MSPVRVHIVVEGETERDFVDGLLAPAFLENDIYLDARLIGKPGHKGGYVKWQRLLADLEILLLGDRSAYTTTLFDFFRMGTDFPDSPHTATGTTAEKRQTVEESMKVGLERHGLSGDAIRRFIPYVQMYEFEGVLFANPRALAKGLYRDDLTPTIEAIRVAFPSPEDINDGLDTAPSKRLISIFSGYKKPLYGNLAALEVGLLAMRRECRHFNDWLTKLESLSELT